MLDSQASEILIFLMVLFQSLSTSGGWVPLLWVSQVPSGDVRDESRKKYQQH